MFNVLQFTTCLSFILFCFFSFAKHLLTEWQMFMSILKPIIQCTYTWEVIIINLFEWNKTNVSKLSENIFLKIYITKWNRRKAVRYKSLKSNERKIQDCEKVNWNHRSNALARLWLKVLSEIDRFRWKKKSIFNTVDG